MQGSLIHNSAGSKEKDQVRGPTRLREWIRRKLLDYGIPILAFFVTLYSWKVAVKYFDKSLTDILLGPIGWIATICIFIGTITICLVIVRPSIIKDFLLSYRIPFLSFVVTLLLSKLAVDYFDRSLLEIILNPLGLTASIGVFALMMYTMRRSNRIKTFLASLWKIPEPWIKWIQGKGFVPPVIVEFVDFAGVPGFALVVTIFLLWLCVQFSDESIKMILEHPWGLPITLGVFLGTIVVVPLLTHRIEIRQSWINLLGALAQFIYVLWKELRDAWVENRRTIFVVFCTCITTIPLTLFFVRYGFHTKSVAKITNEKALSESFSAANISKRLNYPPGFLLGDEGDILQQTRIEMIRELVTGQQAVFIFHYPQIDSLEITVRRHEFVTPVAEKIFTGGARTLLLVYDLKTVVGSLNSNWIRFLVTARGLDRVFERELSPVIPGNFYELSLLNEGLVLSNFGAILRSDETTPIQPNRLPTRRETAPPVAILAPNAVSPLDLFLLVSNWVADGDGEWSITNNEIRQSRPTAGNAFYVCQQRFPGYDLKVSLVGVSSSEPRSFIGLVFGYEDPRNYYVIALLPRSLGSLSVIFRRWIVSDGRRIALKEIDISPTPEEVQSTAIEIRALNTGQRRITVTVGQNRQDVLLSDWSSQLVSWGLVTVGCSGTFVLGALD